MDRSRGRPKKGPEKRSHTMTIMVPPSGKKIIRQEADRCGTTMTKIVEKYSKEAIEARGRHMPVPKIHSWILKKANNVKRKVKEEDEGEIENILNSAIDDLIEKLEKLQEQREEREKLREDMPSEHYTAEISYRVSNDLRDWYEGKSDKGVTKMIRTSVMEEMENRNMMKETEDWLGGIIKTLIKVMRECENEFELRKSTLKVFNKNEKKIKREIFDFEG